MKKTSFSLLVLLSLVARGSTVDTGMVESALLGRNVEYIVVRPSRYETLASSGARFGVLYLLHCAGCDHLSWLSQDYCEGLAELADSVNLLLVAPYDGTSASWWLDSPIRPDSRMSRFLIEELKVHIDSSYATSTDRKRTALAGHSMGGFGALHNTMYYSDVFGAAVAIKPGVDIFNPLWPSDFGLTSVLGSQSANRANWEWATVLDNAAQFKNKDSAIRLYKRSRRHLVFRGEYTTSHADGLS